MKSIWEACGRVDVKILPKRHEFRWPAEYRSYNSLFAWLTFHIKDSCADPAYGHPKVVFAFYDHKSTLKLSVYVYEIQ